MMRLLNKKYFFKAILFLFFTLLFIKGLVILDPDFGWRVRSGGIYLQEGIPKTDIYTYTMPGFPWVDHAYLQSIAFYLTNEVFGRKGLSLMMVGLTFFALKISLSGNDRLEFIKKLDVEKGFLSEMFEYLFDISFWLGAAVIISYLGIRVQVATWLFLAVFLRIALDEKLWKKYRKLAPFYFILWANLHGGFASGLSAWAIILFSRALKRKRFYVLNLILFIVSSLATLLNPYGAGLWREVYSSVSDSALHFLVAEWMPSIFLFDLAMAALFTFSATLIYKYRDKFLLEEKLLYLLFLTQAIVSRRNLPLWIIVMAPFLDKAINLVYKEARRVKNGEERFLRLYKGALFGSIIILIIQSAISIWGGSYISEGSFYPEKGVSFLKSDLPAGNIFADYNWGGYLIWKLPEKKVFVDGRMPSWHWDAPNGEEEFAFRTYREIISGEEDYKKYFEKYDIDTVFLPERGGKGFYYFIQQKLDNALEKFGKEKEEEFNFQDKLSEDGWEKEYEDSISEIYKRPN